ncbi:hypothetical protein BJX68DRAFT_238683 [Aspergillus pseudodeflectus]|uniref:DUF6536 domain-containing protein n=1 Tax=Aspergillus pseudodeflectus TaxID=176178 RepID=A0ABR4K7C3_9EURO
MKNPIMLELASLRRNHEPLEQDDAENKDIAPPRKRHGGRFGGWKGTLCLGATTSVVVLILNLVMLLWATLRHSATESVLFSGSCDRVKQISAGIHFLINILSTLLLSASNYAMQCLSAPSRGDLDRAHAKNKWLDIGVPSLRNLTRIPTTRSLFWCCLVFSSAPLHLFYNSSVYSTISANAYDVYVSNSSVSTLTPEHVTLIYDGANDMLLDYAPARKLVEQASILKRLSIQECLDAYATNFQSKYGSVVLISDGFSGANSSMSRVYSQQVPSAHDNLETDPYRWICAERRGMALEQPCSQYLSDIRSHDDWVVYGYKVDYCLADMEGEKCTLEFSLPLAIAVIGTNFVKAVLIVLATVLLSGAPILTVGDAIASFLRSPDKMAEGNCLLSRELVALKSKEEKVALFSSTMQKMATFCTCKLGALGVKVPSTFRFGSYTPRHWEDQEKPAVYNATPKRRWSSLSLTRWVLCLFTYTSALILCIALLIHGVTRLDDQSGLWTSGLASINTKTMVDTLNWPGGLIPNTLIANVPQLIFSALYFMCNAILTNMALATEWDRFAITRKGLRVSTPPQGHQRRTHFLSLPYRYGVPLIALSALLHWLISQSIFLVRIVVYRDGEREPSGDTMTVGYSPPAIVIGVCVGVLLPAGLLLTGRRRFRSGMPVAGSCSLAIAAACQPRSAETMSEGIEYERLKWGVEPCEEGKVGHCAFSGAKVDTPVDGMVYQ